MRRVIAGLTLFALLLTGSSFAQVVSERPTKITSDQIKAAAKSVVAESQTNQSDQDTKAVKRNTTIIVILLSVAIVGTALYLIDHNSKKHGGSGIFGDRTVETKQAPIQYRQPLLREQWHSR